MEIKCYVCGTTDTNKVFIPCTHEGESKNVCVRCLPVLIHGQH